VAILKMCEGGRRGDWIRLVVAVVVERRVDKGVVGEPKDDVAHAVGLGSGQLVEDALDSSLVLIRCLSRPHRVARNQPLLHGLLPSLLPGS
jgi:hypothetical protein